MIDVSQQTPERRHTPRHRAFVPVQFGSSAGEPSMGLAQNISDQGLLVASRRAFDVGRPLELNVHVDPDAGQVVRLDAHVVRTTDNDADPNGLWPYKVAVHFDQPVSDLVRDVLQTQ